MKKRYMSLLMIFLLIVTLIPINAFASVKEDTAEPYTGRHYTVKEEVIADRRTNEPVYSVYDNPSTATRRAYCFSETHYIVYPLRVCDPDSKRKLYDEYHTTWKGQWRKKVGDNYSDWMDDPDYPKKSEVSKERSPIYDMFLGLYPASIGIGEVAE